MTDAEFLKVPFARPACSREEDDAVLAVLHSQWLTTGKCALEFERRFSELMNGEADCAECAGCNGNTDRAAAGDCGGNHGEADGGENGGADIQAAASAKGADAQRGGGADGAECAGCNGNADRADTFSAARFAEARRAAGLDTRPVASLAVNSNTSGMILAMEACGVGPGTAVVTTPYTFVSTAMCARHLGADVLFADTESGGYNIDADKVEALLAADRPHRIRAVVPVHIGGLPCDMARLCALGKKYGVRIIEDAAHSFPSPTRLGYAGTVGDAGVFSFYVTKPLTTAEGGMVCARDPDLVRRMAVMRMHGMDRAAWDRYTSPRASWEYDIVAPGYKFNLPDILAAIGCAQLDKAQALYGRRARIAEMYNRAFKDLDFIELPPDGEGNAWHLYMIRLVPEKLACGRDEFARELQRRGIGVSVHYIPLFRFTYWKNLYPGFTAEKYPNAERQYSRSISLPLWPDMTDDMTEAVIRAVTETGGAMHG